jgi:hypothetical protein
VISSTNPWVEACILEAGANEIVTLEYGVIYSKQPQSKTMVTLEFCRDFLENKLEKFDACKIQSSLEWQSTFQVNDTGT